MTRTRYVFAYLLYPDALYSVHKALHIMCTRPCNCTRGTVWWWDRHNTRTYWFIAHDLRVYACVCVCVGTFAYHPCIIKLWAFSRTLVSFARCSWICCAYMWKDVRGQQTNMLTFQRCMVHINSNDFVMCWLWWCWHCVNLCLQGVQCGWFKFKQLLKHKCMLGSF